MTAPERTICLALASLVVLLADQTGHIRAVAAERLVIQSSQHSSSVSTAQPESEADRHLSRGLAFYEARDFEQAIAEFHAGYRVDPRPELLFALAQAERRSGDCASALVYYRRFLATKPPAQQARAARAHQTGCQAALRSGPAHHDQATRSRLPASARAMVRSPWYHDVVADVLVGASAASILVGVGFLSASQSAREDAITATTYPEHVMQLDRAHRHRSWGLVGLAGGATFATLALVRLTARRGHPWRESAGAGSVTSTGAGQPASASHLAITPGASGFTLSYGGSF